MTEESGKQREVSLGKKEGAMPYASAPVYNTIGTPLKCDHIMVNEGSKLETNINTTDTLGLSPPFEISRPSSSCIHMISLLVIFRLFIIIEA